MIFYWFVEAQKDPDNAPLILWTNGGPGCSGLAGFFTENGPFRVGYDGTNLLHNHYAWNKVANMIFVEQPAGVGFSPAGENPKYSDENSANDNRHFIMKFYERYPALKTHDFYLSSESYGGHYLPTLGKLLVEKGLSDSGWVKPPNWTRSPLEGVITAGGPCTCNLKSCLQNRCKVSPRWEHTNYLYAPTLTHLLGYQATTSSEIP